MPPPNIVNGTSSSETIDAMDGVTNGNDTIYGYGGDDTIYALGGNDILIGGTGADILDGGAGSDTAYYADSAQAVIASLALGHGYGGEAEGDTFVNVENLLGSVHDDVLVGNSGDNKLSGASGDDTLVGGDGSDELWGGSGNDTLKGGGGADSLHGGLGYDTAAYNDSADRVFVSLMTNSAAGGDAEGDTLDSIENLTGSVHADSLLGNDGVNVLKGLDGNDSLKGYGGADTLWGGAGNDSLFGMDGVDSLRGESGHDWLDGGAGADTMIGGAGNDTYVVDNAGDVITESIGQGTDHVKTSTTYSLAPGCEVEFLEATDADDTTSFDLVGNAFDNTVIGNDGQNTIVGGLGLDTMTGNNGGDTFVWTSTAETGHDPMAADTVTDFNRGEGDLIAVNPIDADVTTPGDQAFTFIGTAPLTAPGQISYFNDGTDTYILLNTDADSDHEAAIRVLGLHTVDATWFVL